MLDQINDILKHSPVPDAEEWAIHDYEGFGSYKVQEWHDLDTLCELAEIMNDYQGELIIEVAEWRVFRIIQ